MTYTNNTLTRAKLPIVDPHPEIIMDAQAVVPNLPSLHYVSGFDSGTVNNIHWPHLRKANYKWIVVVGAAQYSEARDFARNVQNDPLRTNVIFRHWKSVLGSASDNGRMGVLTGAEWMERVGSQHIHAPYWIMPDNEGLGVTVAKNTADLIPRASSVKLKLAVGAWSSHNPARADWLDYMPLFEQLYAHPEHVYAAHIYYSKPPKSVENMDGFTLVADHLRFVEQRMGAPIPFEVVITEVGRLANPNGTWLDPDKGYGLEGIGERDYADELVKLAVQYPKWTLVTFSRGAWGTRGSLGVGKDYENRMEEYASGAIAMPIPLEPEPEENPIPPGFAEYILNTTANMKLRDKPVSGLTKFLVPVGARLHAAKASVHKPDGQALEWVEVIYTHIPKTGTPTTYRGWMGILNSFDEQFTPLPPVEEPPVPPKEPPTEPEPDPTIQYVTAQEAKDMVDAAKEATMQYMKEWTLALLTELAKADADAQVKKIDLLEPKEAA